MTFPHFDFFLFFFSVFTFYCFAHYLPLQEVKEESDDDNNAKALDSVIENQKTEINSGKEECKKVESDKSMIEGKEKDVKENGGFMRGERKNLREISEKKSEINARVATDKK